VLRGDVRSMAMVCAYWKRGRFGGPAGEWKRDGGMSFFRSFCVPWGRDWVCYTACE